MEPAREPASSRPRPCASLKKPHESCPFTAPCAPCRKKNDRGQTSACPLQTSRLAPSILAHRGSALPWLVDDRAALRLYFAESGAYPPDRALPGSPRQCPLPLACRHPPEGPKGTKSEFGRGAHLGTPSTANHTAAASQPTG